MKFFVDFFSACFILLVFSACMPTNDQAGGDIPCEIPDCGVSSLVAVSSVSEPLSQIATSSGVEPVSSAVVSSSSAEPPIDFAANFQQILPKDQFEFMFPPVYKIPFYTYEGLVEAVRQISELKLKISDRNLGWEAPYVERWNGSSWELAYQHRDYTSSLYADRTPVVTEADFSKFLTEGSLDDKKREIAAMLAHMSQETTGKGPNDPYNRGLMFNEEQNAWNTYISNNVSAYTPSWSPMASSYHGRGAFQLSWNYNYARYSYEVYGDNRALADPSMVLDNDVETYKAAIWFWMRPQYPKPSMHDVMLGKAPDDGKGGSASKFGWTINVINGAIECGTSNEKAGHRGGYYQRYAQIMGVTIESNLSCASMTPY